MTINPMGGHDRRTVLRTTRRPVTLSALTTVVLAGCSTATPIRDSSGNALVMIECGSSTSFSVCYDRAAKECPNGYRTVSEEPGFNRKTLKVECKR